MTAATQPQQRTAYKVKAMTVEACSCAHGCNCQFGGTTMRVDHESLRMSWPAKYASTAEVNWTNAG